MSIFKDFRGVGQLPQFNTISKRFDEPTYLTFLLQFAPGGDFIYNNSQYNAFYDNMPHPLFNNRDKYISLDKRNDYAAIDYLYDANENTRVSMLQQFISKFNELQNNSQWYFQKLDGVLDILNINTKKGQRIQSDKRLTITCLEGIDLRMSYLLNLYKKIVWDDVYQRWVLPDMMRYFTLDIYISEFRTFHTPANIDSTGYIIQNAGLSPISNPQSPQQKDLVLNIMDDILPTWKIKCEMCEFDIEDLGFNSLSSMSLGADPEQATVVFKIKVGNIKEIQIYPMFQCMFLDDITINNSNRSNTNNINTTSPNNLGANSFPENDNRGYPANLQVAQNQLYENDVHISGLPYLENANQNILVSQSNLSNTWLGNAATFGKAFVNNMVNSALDKAKITPIYGVSYEELNAAIQSKNIMSMLGLLKTASDTISSSLVAPSSKLSEPISDNIFNEFLNGIAASTATDGSKVSNLVKIVQNMLSSGDLNKVYLDINTFKSVINNETKGSLSYATNNKKINDSGNLEKTDVLSKATTSKIII